MSTRVLFISNLNHNEASLKKWSVYSPERNLSEIFGSSNIPLGILSIEAYIKKNCKDVETEILDLNNEFIKRLIDGDVEKNLVELSASFEAFLKREIEEHIVKFKPDIIAISSLFDKSIPTLFKICKIIKEIERNILIIAGGHPVNNLYKDVLQDCDDTIDAISLGEGEIPFSELLNSEDKLTYIQRSNYFATKEKCLYGQKQQLKTTYVENLDDIPFYDYDTYLAKYGDVILSFHNNILDNAHSFNKQAVIMTSRGCPYNCVFCASYTIHSKKMRKHSLERVKAEVDYFVDKCAVDSIGFIDDHILFDVDRAIEICDYVGSKKIDFRFPNGLAIAPITKEFVHALERNKVKEVQLALESGSERVLREIIHKPLTLKLASQVFDYFKETSIFVRIFLVVGFPEETKEDILESLQFLRSANFHWASISSPTPISGSQLFKQSMENGYLQSFDYTNISFFSEIFHDQVAENTGFENLRYMFNLDINFVNNPYMRMGKIEAAKEKFEVILKNYPDHAFALYYLHKCQKQLNEDSSITAQKYNSIIKSNEQWLKYAKHFNLDLTIS
ncbi:MAG: radical SAM protein [Bacillota bacterium]